jgi:AraC-like DNA-binding protein
VVAVPGPLDDALAQLRLDGAIFFRAEMTEAWSYESPPTEMASLLRPGAERLIMFHIVAAGRCWVSVDGQERHWASAGDVIVLPYGDQHRVGGTDDAEIVPILDLLDPPPWATLPVLRYGAGGARTDVVCGYLHSEDPLFNPDMSALPPVFVVRPPDGPAKQWITASVEYALAAGSASLPDPPPSTRLPEALLTEILRIHLMTAPAIERGWIAALHDPVLAPAMAELHAEPGRKWTVADLAASAAVSRSLLDERFRQVLGLSPIRYLTEWRMHVAEALLAGSDAPVSTIARRVGYDSEEAFSRAFKRATGRAPSHWRTLRGTAS